jgi:rhodanese-related sulfurtransferase
MSVVARVPAAEPREAAAHFAARLRYETDVSDVHADLTAGEPGVVVVDSRGENAWRQGHLPGAVHLPTGDIARLAARRIPAGATVVVTYCWGPGCNGATRAAYELARLGYPVKEMIGGYQYWVEEGLPVQTPTGLTSRPANPLTALAPGTVSASGIACDC